MTAENVLIWSFVVCVAAGTLAVCTRVARFVLEFVEDVRELIRDR